MHKLTSESVLKWALCLLMSVYLYIHLYNLHPFSPKARLQCSSVWRASDCQSRGCWFEHCQSHQNFSVIVWSLMLCLKVICPSPLIQVRKRSVVLGRNWLALVRWGGTQGRWTDCRDITKKDVETGILPRKPARFCCQLWN